jgi:hypothetical protein
MFRRIRVQVCTMRTSTDSGNLAASFTQSRSCGYHSIFPGNHTKFFGELSNLKKKSVPQRMTENTRTLITTVNNVTRYLIAPGTLPQFYNFLFFPSFVPLAFFAAVSEQPVVVLDLC